MTAAQRLVFVGTDGGATTSKTGAVWSDGTTVSTRLLQKPTGSAGGPEAVVQGWVEGIAGYLGQNGLDWESVGGVGLAIPGPYQRYGVFDRSPNCRRALPASTSTQPMPARLPRRPVGQCPRLSATTATWAALRKRSGSAATRRPRC